MSEVWDTLIKIQDRLIDRFDATGTEVEEPGMDRFNQPGWINRVWNSDKYRRAHVDVVDARDTKGLWMMHCCVFPHLDNDGPIFGLDVIAGKNKITGYFHDYSPTTNPANEMIEAFGDEVAKLEWRKPRELPEWAKAIFTEHMVAAGNVNSTEELEQLLELSFDSIDNYLEYIDAYNGIGKEEVGKEAQNRYAHFQKQNPHTPRTMTSLGLDEEDVRVFVQECLFPDID
jgi:phycocyanobilin:ferredoxin oxidoreductase|tara:strand:- start:1044 stop:1730 length:687 start_codon:yes stop_codon:yes gene_type:complete